MDTLQELFAKLLQTARAEDRANNIFAHALKRVEDTRMAFAGIARALAMSACPFVKGEEILLPRHKNRRWHYKATVVDIEQAFSLDRDLPCLINLSFIDEALALYALSVNVLSASGKSETLKLLGTPQLERRNGKSKKNSLTYQELCACYQKQQQKLADEGFQRVLEITGFDNGTMLALALNLPPQRFADDQEQGELSAEILLALLEKYRLNPQWVKTGEGSPYLLSSEQDADTERTLSSLLFLCTLPDRGRGIWGRIEENRELMELVIGNTANSNFLQSYPWIPVWLGKLDAFLMSLQKLLGLPDNPAMFGGAYPRPWPGDKCWSNRAEYLVNISRKHSGCDPERLQKIDAKQS